MFNIHPLVVEDILERNQRAKIEVSDDTLHLVMFALRTTATRRTAHEFEIVLGHRFLLTVHDDTGPSPREAPFRRRDTSAYLAGGPDFVLWAITDWLVDGYFPVFDQVGDEIDALEEAIIDKPGRWVVEQLFDVRRDLLTIRHAVTPQREIFNQLTNRDVHLIKRERIVYFRDVYDHLIRLTDELDSYRELVSTTLDIYLSQINNNLSEDHEAADRGDRRAGRDRGDRRHLRHERGRQHHQWRAKRFLADHRHQRRAWRAGAGLLPANRLDLAAAVHRVWRRQGVGSARDVYA